MSAERYSLVMRDFSGEYSEFDAAAEQALGRRGIAAFSLCSQRRNHLPAEIVAALKQAYPERIFVICYIEDQVSFYQRGNGAPETDIPARDEPRAKAFCETCRKGRPYRTHEGIDAEFLEADWGTCLECGDEVV